MTTFRVSKVVSALPEALEADTVYAVRAGAGYDLYITDSTGLLAFKGNPSQTWAFFKEHFSVLPAKVGEATVSDAVGDVLAFTNGGVTRFRFISKPYDPAVDAFYAAYSDGSLSGLICTRGTA